MRINLLIIIFLLFSANVEAARSKWLMPPTPLPMASLKKELSLARGQAKNKGKWPRKISFVHQLYDYHKGTFHQEKTTIEIKKPPQRIIPHAVGTTEILWAICPRERLVMLNELVANPRFSIIADEVAKNSHFYNAKKFELVIAARPDMVFTVVFSDAAFKTRLHQAGIQTIDLGSPDSLESVIDEIKILGQIIGETANAKTLLEVMTKKLTLLQDSLPHNKKPPRLLYYDFGGYIPGVASNFTSLCKMIGAVNVGAEQGVKSWKQIDHETLLSWDPDMIIVPLESELVQKLKADPLLCHTRAVKNHRLRTIPSIYLRINSQFIILGANLLAGIVYQNGN